MAWLLAFGFIAELLFVFVNAQDPVIPVLNDNICPKKALVFENNEFRYENAPNSPIKPKEVFLGGHDYRYVYSHNLDYGQTLYFHGKVNTVSLSFFEINFIVTEPVAADDAVRILHFKPYLNKGYIVFNTHDQDWGREEHCPIPDGWQNQQPFILKIHVTPTAFDFVMNGRPFYSFNQRSPANVRSFIAVSGDIELSKIRSGGPLLDISKKFPLYSGLAWGDRLFLSVVSESGSFNINFFNSNDSMVQQFVFDFDHKTIVSNNFVDGKQHGEEKGDGFPLEAGIEFDIDFLPDFDRMIVALKDRFYGFFKHYTDDPKMEYASIQFENSVTVFDFEICPRKKP